MRESQCELIGENTDLPQSDTRDDHLDDISEGGIQQPSDTLAGPEGNLFRSQPKQSGKRDDTEGREHEHQGGALVGEMKGP